jgi:hypothetical protein
MDATAFSEHWPRSLKGLPLLEEARRIRDANPSLCFFMAAADFAVPVVRKLRRDHCPLTFIEMGARESKSDSLERFGRP